MDLTDVPPALHEATDTDLRAVLDPVGPRAAAAPLPSAAHKAIYLMARHGVAACFKDGFAVAWRPGQPEGLVRIDTFETDGCPMQALLLAVRELLLREQAAPG
jgi:hypothetical protein